MSLGQDITVTGLSHPQHHEFKWPIEYRQVHFAGRVIARDIAGRYTYEKDSKGDWLPTNLWLRDPNNRPMSGWSYAWASKAVHPGNGTPTPGGPACPPNLPASEYLPIADEDWNPDGRFLTKMPSLPQITPGVQLDGKIPRGVPGIILSTTEERQQTDLFLPAFRSLIAVQNAGDFDMGSRVYDTTNSGELDPTRFARLQSAFWVIKVPVATCGSFFGVDPADPTKPVNNLAWNINASNCDDTRGGLIIDFPDLGAEGIATAGQRVIALVSHHDGGPLNVGGLTDKHKLGKDADNRPINSNHHSANVLIYRNKKEDGPDLYEPEFLNGTIVTPPIIVAKMPFKTYVHKQWDELLTHQHPCGTLSGNFRWWAQSMFTTPTEGGGVPRPDPEPDPEDDPEGGVPTGSEGFGGGGLPGGPLPGLPFPPPNPANTSGEVDVAEFSPSFTASLVGSPMLSVDRGESEGIRARDAVDGHLDYAATTLEIGTPTLLAQPQGQNQSFPDLRNDMSPAQKAVEDHFRLTPITGRLEAFAQQDPISYGYTVGPRQAKYLGGTANGGWVLTPAELGLEDLLDLTIDRPAEPPFDDIITDFPPRTASVATILAVPGTYFAGGIPDRSTGQVKFGYRHSADLNGNYNFDCVDKDGVIRNIIKLRQNCTVGIPLAGHISGARLTFVTVAIVDVGTAGEDSEVTDSTAQTALKWTGTLRADITASGAGGLDTGAEAADTFYAVYIIGDSSGTNSPAAMLSTSATAPTLPTGFDVFRRVGWVRNDSGSDFLNFTQHYSGRDRWIYYDENDVVTQVLSAGNALVFTDVDLSSFQPSTSTQVHLFIFWDPQNSANELEMRPDGSAADPPLYQVRSGATGADETFQVMPTSAAQVIEYRAQNANDAADMSVAGYVDEL